jgi:hypothetical protein
LISPSPVGESRWEKVPGRADEGLFPRILPLEVALIRRFAPPSPIAAQREKAKAAALA